MSRPTGLLPMLVLLLSACATLQPGDEAATRLQEEIRSGEAVAVGERVRITTRDGVERVILVGAVDDRYVHGQVVDDAADDVAQAAPGTDTVTADVAIDGIVRLEPVQVDRAARAIDFRDTLYLAAIGILMFVAAFANF